MDRELYMLTMRVQMNTLYLKIKLSREEIEQKHPTRSDLITSMREGERMAVEAYEFIRLASDEMGQMQKVINAQNFTNLKLEAENIELRKLNASLLAKVNL